MGFQLFSYQNEHCQVDTLHIKQGQDTAVLLLLSIPAKNNLYFCKCSNYNLINHNKIFHHQWNTKLKLDQIFGGLWGWFFSGVFRWVYPEEPGGFLCTCPGVSTDCKRIDSDLLLKLLFLLILQMIILQETHRLHDRPHEPMPLNQGWKKIVI